MTSGRTFLGGAALGAALQYFVDRSAGRRRRRAARARAGAVLRRAERRARGVALLTEGRARGAVHALRPTPVHPLDDVELAHKVESVLGRDRRLPKGRLSVNAERGTVYLRGVLDDERQIERVAVRVWRVPEVTGVVNLLHLPGTSTPQA
jgi:hypothetical protein